MNQKDFIRKFSAFIFFLVGYYILKSVVNLLSFQFIIKLYSALLDNNFMRLSTSPPMIRNHLIRNQQQYYEVHQNNRSNSHSQLSLHSSKFQTKIDNQNYSPYYHQNSQVRIISPQQLNLQPKSVSVVYNNVEGPSSLQLSIKKLTQKLQSVEKRLKKQESQISSIQKSNQQRLMMDKIHQKINQQMHKKSTLNYQEMVRKIKQLDFVLVQKIDIDNKKEHQTFLTQSKKQNQHSQFIDSENTLIQKKNSSIIIENRIKQEIKKVKSFFQDQLKKSIQLLKKNIENITKDKDFSILSKSKLKYKLRPLEICVKNQVSINKNPSQLKSSKKLSSLSTAHSSGSSQENDLINSMSRKTVSIQQQLYFIDRQGYLLDQNGYYILNEKEKMIKIEKSIIKKLEQMKILN